MASYLIIETRDPFESRDVQFVVDTASALTQRGHDVTVFLVQNGALAARKGAKADVVEDLAEAGVALLVDDFSLVERGIDVEELRPACRISTVDELVRRLVDDDTKAIWH